MIYQSAVSPKYSISSTDLSISGVSHIRSVVLIYQSVVLVSADTSVHRSTQTVTTSLWSKPGATIYFICSFDCSMAFDKLCRKTMLLCVRTRLPRGQDLTWLDILKHLYSRTYCRFPKAGPTATFPTSSGTRQEGLEGPVLFFTPVRRMHARIYGMHTGSQH